MLPYLYRVPRCQAPAGILVDEQRSLIGWWHCERVRDPHSEVGWSAWRYYDQITSSIALTAAKYPQLTNNTSALIEVFLCGRRYKFPIYPLPGIATPYPLLAPSTESIH